MTSGKNKCAAYFNFAWPEWSSSNFNNVFFTSSNAHTVLIVLHLYNILKNQEKINIKIKIYKTLLTCKGVKLDLARYGKTVHKQAADNTFKRESNRMFKKTVQRGALWLVLFTRCYLGDHIKDDTMKAICSTHDSSEMKTKLVIKADKKS